MPSRETELVELTRDYETLRLGYTTLLAKSENARMSANLERRQIGEQFRVLEPARPPERPISPNRVANRHDGAAGGLALGLGLVFLLEYRDRSLRTEADVLGAFRVPVLALIPRIVGAVERRRRWRRRGLLDLRRQELPWRSAPRGNSASSVVGCRHVRELAKTNLLR